MAELRVGPWDLIITLNGWKRPWAFWEKLPTTRLHPIEESWNQHKCTWTAFHKYKTSQSPPLECHETSIYQFNTTKINGRSWTGKLMLDRDFLPGNSEPSHVSSKTIKPKTSAFLWFSDLYLTWETLNAKQNSKSTDQLFLKISLEVHTLSWTS